MSVCLTMPLMRGKGCTQLYRSSGVASRPYLILVRLNTNGVAMIPPVWATVTAASLLHGDFLAANDNGKHPRARPLLSTPTWSPPPAGTIAITVDGAFTQAQGAGIGVVARDSAGTVLGGFAQHSVVPGLSASAEAAAVLAGLHFACEQGGGGFLCRHTDWLNGGFFLSRCSGSGWASMVAVFGWSKALVYGFGEFLGSPSLWLLGTDCLGAGRGGFLGFCPLPAEGFTVV
ncbi:hypothetical protein V6N12_013785 [Hibiscus sabdariffa]|uniref:RNase H type-1 domain-containing protein n=1 Tax=Hibiscus sabdariffa TaxID=183260 RepID=A0ABR2CV85_9ROSI